MARTGKRGFKRGVDVTVKAKFVDPRSFISIDNHQLLFGEDKTLRRIAIWRRAGGRCELNASPRCRGFASLSVGEWHHANTAPHRNRCDCIDNGVWACGPCHRFIDRRKPRLRWMRIQQAGADFDKVMGITQP